MQHSIYRFDSVIVKRLKNPLLAVDWIFWRTPLGRKTKILIKSLRSFTEPVGLSLFNLNR